MASSWLLKIPRSDDSGGHVLVQVSHRHGHADLDLTLFATESEAVYKSKGNYRSYSDEVQVDSKPTNPASCSRCVLQGLAYQFIVRQKKLKDLRSSRYNGSDDEWEAILRHSFLSEEDSSISPELKKGVEIVAAVSGKDDHRSLTVTFRNRIDQITQKLGSIELKETEEEIQLFDWASGAVDRQRTSQEKVVNLQSKSENDQATITALQAQVADLVRAKSEHEEQLMSKFALLLNEKKLEIRNQQRILSIAKVDRKKLAQLRLTLDGTRRQPAGRKRRAETEAQDGDQEKDESDGFETMAVDHMPNAVGDARSSRETTPETETESEDGEAADLPAQPTLATELPTSKPGNGKRETPPPPRALPFVKKGAQKKNDMTETEFPQPLLGSDEETASEDDEL